MLDVTRLRILDAVARTGSVTAASKELQYSQPSVSHHLARLESESGAQLLQRVGRGIRLTEAGRVLAERAAEIIGRLDAATAELDTYVSLGAGRVRVAAYSTAVVSLLPRVAKRFEQQDFGLRIDIVDTHPPEALDLLRRGVVDAAIVFRYEESAQDPPGVRLQYLRDDPTYLLTLDGSTMADLHDATWVGGCARCTEHLIELCERAGFEPRIAHSTDDMVAIQALVAGGMGVATIPGLALEAHRHPGIQASVIPGGARQIFLATYGDPPDPPSVGAFAAALEAVAVTSGA